MAKYYLVKRINTATQENPTCAGEVHVYYYGKEHHLIACEGVKYFEKPLFHEDAKEYGYARKCDATHCSEYKNIGNTHWWTHTVEIVEIEV